uniref:DNA polymerase kappa n=1 Tax=Peronospora matthiolae TaxID=2874970 RepID=A0AAV1VKU8_9STRA
MFVFTAEKAGMKGVDKQHVQEVVHKLSKDSSFYQKSLRDNGKVQQRVVAMREKLSRLSSAQLVRLTQETDVRVAQMEASRDLSHIIVVVDMDMFYAAVEMRDKPELRDVPLAVGGLNMISTANYAARQYGVRAAMPGFIGKELCPELHFVPVNMEKYKRVAAQIRAVFAVYDPNFEAFSLDEACLDLTDYVVKYWRKYVSAAVSHAGSIELDDEEAWTLTAAGRAAIAEVIVRELRAKIFDCTQLTASAGIAANVMLAKICSDLNKPNGQYVLPFTREGVMSFIRDLPVRKIGGIGKVTEKILNEALNVYTGAELFAQRGKIAYLFSEKTAEWLLRTSLGVRERRGKQERKSFSRERTFSRLSDPKQLEAKCKEICIMLAQDLERADKAAKNVTFVYKDTAFARCSRSMTLASAIFTADDLFANAVELLRRELPLTLRLMGIRAATLVARSKASMDLSQPDLGNKKRQVAINKFAELVDNLAPVSMSGSSRSHDQDPVKKVHVVASVAAPLHNKQSSTPECEETSLVGAEDTFVPNASDDGRHPRRDTITTTDRSHSFALGLNLKNLLEVDNQPCPICGKLLNVRNNFEVNAHMDVCVLSETSSSPRSSLLQRTVVKQPKKKIIPSVFAHVQTMSEKADAKPCPVCGKLLNACNSMEVNVHMDACVARSRFSAGRTTGKKRSGHEMSRKNPGNSIGAFFRKHYNDT